MRNYYDGASSSRRTQGWPAPTASPNAALGSLTTLRARSRAATRNDGFAKGVIDKLVTNIVGTGIKPLSQAPESSFRQAVHELWAAFTDESDADGLLDFYGQEAQIVRAWLEGGECYARFRFRRVEDGLAVPLQLQVLEPELCPHGYGGLLPSGARVRGGAEFDAIGRLVAYWFHPSRPGDWEDFDSSRLVRVPADSVAHLYDPLRPGTLRGVPYLTQTLVKLYELDKFDDATLLRQQIANLFVGFVTRQPGEGTEEDVDPLTGAAKTFDADDKPMVAMEPALFQELAPGEDVKFSTPPGTPDGYVDFMRQQLFAICAATGVPYEVLTGDMKGVSDRTLRVILLEFRRRIQGLQHQVVVFQFCRRVWNVWFDRAVLSGALRVPPAYFVNPKPWRAVKWMPQGWPYLHPVQDVDAQKAAARSGFTSRSAIISEQGEDAELIDAEQAADNERADRLGLRYDSDGRRAANGAPPAADEPADPSMGATK